MVFLNISPFSRNEGENNAELSPSPCLEILRSKMGPKKHICFNLLPYNKEVSEQSLEYGLQMEKLEKYFLNGRELVNGFVMRQSLKYSENFFNRFLEVGIGLDDRLNPRSDLL